MLRILFISNFVLFLSPNQIFLERKFFYILLKTSSLRNYVFPKLRKFKKILPRTVIYELVLMKNYMIKGQWRSHKVTFILKIAHFLRYLFHLKSVLIETLLIWINYKDTNFSRCQVSPYSYQRSHKVNFMFKIFLKTILFKTFLEWLKAVTYVLMDNLCPCLCKFSTRIWFSEFTLYV